MTKLVRGLAALFAVAFVGALLMLTCCFLATGNAQDSDFYRGKNISIIIPIGPGGAYDGRPG